MALYQLLKSSKNIYRSGFRIAIIHYLTMTVVTLLLFGCTGATGPDGDNAVIADTLAPVIEWLLPESGSDVDSIETLSVYARDDQGIRRVVFYIAGWEAEGQLVDSAMALYSYNWDSSDYPIGPYPLVAKAWDVSSNLSTTPVIFVWIR